MSSRNRWRGMVAGALIASVAAAGPLGGAGAAFAQEVRKPLSKAQKEEFLGHYDRGTTFYKVGKWAEAIDEYQKAYFISNDPVMLFNMAQAYRLWGRHEDALRLYKVYLNDSPNATNRADAEAKIADLQRLIAEKNAAAAAPGPTSPTAAPVAPPPVNAPPPVAAPASSPAIVAVPKRPAGASTGKRTFGWALIGVTGAFVATSAVLGLMAAAKAREVEDDAENGREFNPDTEKSGKALSGAAVLMGVLGVAAGAAGSYLLITSRSGAGADSVARRAPSGVRATVHPVIGPGLAGAGARLTF